MAGLDGRTAHRLMAPDADGWIDGTGTVWRTGWKVRFEDVWAQETPADGIRLWTNGTWYAVYTAYTAATGTWSVVRQLGETGLEVEYTGAGLPFGTGIWPVRATHVRLDGAEVVPGQITADGWYQIADRNGNLEFVTPLTNHLEVAIATNAVDRLALASEANPGMTTNAVRDIVTNVVELDEWTFSGDVVTGVTYTVDLHGWWIDEDTGEAYDEPGEGRYWEGEITLRGSDGTFGGPEFEWPDATSHTFDMYRDEGGEMVDAGRITATRKHVVRNALGLARLEDLPSTNGLVNADGVRDIVTNVVYSYSAWRVYRRGVDVTDRVSQPVYGRMGWDVYDVITTEDNPPFDRFVHAAQDALALDWTAVTGPLDNEEVAYRATRERASTNTLGLARLEDVPDTSGIAASVNTMWTYVYGGSVWIAVTNYMRTVAGVAPSFQLWEVRDGATNCVYSSAEEIDTRTEDMIHTCRTNLESQVAGVVAAMPDRAWSKYQSATGNESPEGVTIVSTPIIQLTGGGEWYRYVDVSSNSVWFLRSNGVHTFGGDTNGYFRILDDEGNPTFEVSKTDSYTVDAVPESIHFDGDGNFCISFQSNIQPMIYTGPSLSVPAFSGEGEDPNITVTWSHAGGVYTATVEQTVKSASLFAYAKIEVQGTTVIRNTAPTDVSGGILCTDGIHKCRPRYTNGTITWEVVP